MSNFPPFGAINYSTCYSRACCDCVSHCVLWRYTVCLVMLMMILSVLSGVRVGRTMRLVWHDEGWLAGWMTNVGDEFDRDWDDNT